ncbi:MAG: M20/M25/M40 family metallo-hydrolase [Pseudomonadota bacterium]
MNCRLVSALTLSTYLALSALAQSIQPAPIADEIAETADLLIEKGLQDDIGLEFVEGLTTEVGQRLAGSEAETRARAWSVTKLEQLGFENVRIEPFEIPFWSRTLETASIVGPAEQSLVITALGGSAATPKGGVTGEIVRFTSLSELQSADSESVEGKIVFIDEYTTRTQDGSGYGFGVRKRSGCAAATMEKGGLACLIRSVGTQPHRMPHTGIMARDTAVGAGPAAALSPPDADQLNRLLERGPVSIQLNIQIEALEAVESGNVIAEVPGRGEHADEIILIGCHLDSWDLGTGALDDGAGCGIVVGAAKLIADLPGETKRTIRVVLYGAEEVGLFGARAYASAHTSEISNHILASESDFGAGKIWRFQTRFGDAALPYARAMQNTLSKLGVTPGNNQARGGPDIGVLAQAGVPVVTPGQNGSDYFDYHHTPDDTFDKIDTEDFRQNVAVYAAFAWLAAETGWNFRATFENETPAGTG